MSMHPTGPDMQGLSTEQPSRYPYENGIAGRAGDCHGYGPDHLPVESEMSWASGLTPKALEHAGPFEGGRYRGTAPKADPRFGVSRDTRDPWSLTL